MTGYDLQQGERYRVTYRCRDIGYGIEEGEDTFVYQGVESLAGKHIFEPVNQGPTIYLFTDEIVDAEPRDKPDDVWSLLEEAPVYAVAVGDLYHWSTNYDAGDGPFALFLDMIGYSDDEYGMALYGPTVRAADNTRGMSSWDSNLGYVELSKLGAALVEYADRPQDVRAFVDQLISAEVES